MSTTSPIAPLPGDPAARPARDPLRFHGLDAQASSFLLEATRTLADSLDVETTLASVARLSLPFVGAWCIVDLCEGDQLRRVAVIHSDPAQQRLADELRSGWPPKRDGSFGVPVAVRTRRCEVVFPVTDAMLVEAAQSPENLAMLRALRIDCFMTVPLVARGAVLGAITYLASSHGDSFPARERALAEDLAARCAIAIDNARLFQHAQDARAQAEAANLVKTRFLSTMSHELRTPLNAIAGYVELLETGIRGPLTQRQLADLRRVRVNQRHLLGLVEAVLGYARLGAGTTEFLRDGRGQARVPGRKQPVPGQFARLRRHAAHRRPPCAPLSGLVVHRGPGGVRRVHAAHRHRAPRSAKAGARGRAGQ
ncbi:MAG TPA: histidine kinase dimerization/phospho-acceptor domain-containing protein [Longimicrobium sp.]